MRKAFTQKQCDVILNVIRNSDTPPSTRAIANQTPWSCHTIRTRLLDMRSQGEVTGHQPLGFRYKTYWSVKE